MLLTTISLPTGQLKPRKRKPRENHVIVQIRQFVRKTIVWYAICKNTKSEVLNNHNWSTCYICDTIICSTNLCQVIKIQNSANRFHELYLQTITEVWVYFFKIQVALSVFWWPYIFSRFIILQLCIHICSLLYQLDLTHCITSSEYFLIKVSRETQSVVRDAKDLECVKSSDLILFIICLFLKSNSILDVFTRAHLTFLMACLVSSSQVTSSA